MAVVTGPGPGSPGRGGRPHPRRLTRVTAAFCCAIVLVAACSDDDDGAAAPDTTLGPEPTVPDGHSTSTLPEPLSGDIEIPERDGTTPIPVPDLGFGLAVPSGWEATLLTPEALERVAQAELARPAFLISAHRWAELGAVLYAATVDADDRVSDLKVFVTDDVDTSEAALVAHAEEVGTGLSTPAIEVGDDGRVRLTFSDSVPSADDPAAVIDQYGTTIFVADGDRRWELIMTAETPESLAAIVETVEATLTFD